MRRRWEALGAGFRQYVESQQARHAFREAQASRPSLAGFATPMALVAFLNRRDEDAGARNSVFVTLVAMVQAQEESELASALLWLGLWPALDAIHRRRLRCFESQDELVSALAAAFSVLVARVDLSRTQHVAAALVRGTERDVLREQHKALGEQRLHAPLETSSDADGYEDAASWLGPFELQTHSYDFTLEELRLWLHPRVGEDADLLVSVLVLEEDCAEAGARLGLAPAAARKRVQRALQRLRENEKEIDRKDCCPKSARRLACRDCGF
ncbi:sigma-70 family RNA polymerase sigma factor [Myxococcus sp. K15C18031901]|uniref:sigma-70 family RNA polymerase sigma factor n=1 Tax=Myxococcus dinghuensis TaxID=2906761 RepID=UPI0020A7869A|nr:sigma-70 family RNA polymerase sigma factor [Myxococcus dinghuensis]MCP3104213.1 sigma-70 family RNA polymerase sigma factor [Myxococcus dinghuensis]